ncbi:MAG: VWA domain-containing protein [Magnetospirillum gryphiswaldense]|nr:VWA domain-containing protein [Magnetospirillum gryphiswaldense]
MSAYEYHVDVNILVDGTGSMGTLIEGVKRLAVGTHPAIMDALQKEQKHVDKLRVGVTVFRDFGCDGSNALVPSGFFSLPEEESKLLDFVSRITPTGGGDEPENSLEALASALQADWTNEGTKQRHVTLLFSDASPHPYGAVSGPGKPDTLPATFDEVLDIWRGGRQDVKLRSEARRLYLMVPPKVDAYDRLAEEELVAIMPIRDVLASPDVARSHIVSTIVKSV